MSSKVAIIDYGVGNLFSIKHMCNHVGLDVDITSDPKEFLKADALILPGVGAFGDAMDALNRLNFKTSIHEFIKTQKPLLGICLGMQLLFESSEEFGRHDGLGLIPGSVRFFNKPHFQSKTLKVPQVSWNAVYFGENSAPKNSLLNGIENGEDFYFVHSYYVETPQKALCESVYGTVRFCSAIQYNNIHGVQFHPERSGTSGIVFYENLKKLIENNKGEI